MKNSVKKVVLVILVITILALALIPIVTMRDAKANIQWFDFTYSFEYGIIALPNSEVIEGKVESWKDFEDGDQLQVVIDGKTYLTHATNVVLISE